MPSSTRRNPPPSVPVTPTLPTDRAARTAGRALADSVPEGAAVRAPSTSGASAQASSASSAAANELAKGAALIDSGLPPATTAVPAHGAVGQGVPSEAQSGPSPASLAKGGAAPHDRVARAAYFRAERRGFAPGDELADWLAAEAEVKLEDAIVKPALERKQ